MSESGVNKENQATDIARAIEFLDTLTGNPELGLPEDLFLFVSRMTPMVNVDLLIKNERNQTLLTWRDDGYWRPGWHVPGGIIRLRESCVDRVHAVAHSELGAEVIFTPLPLAIHELFNSSRNERGHFISLLYKCTLVGNPDSSLRFQFGNPLSGQWYWHDRCPDNIIQVHEIYRPYIDQDFTDKIMP